MAYLGLAAGALTPAQAQKGPGAAGGEMVFRVCNNTNDHASPLGGSQSYNEGWYGVPSRSCQGSARTGNAYICAHAEVENDGSRFWADDHPLRVQYPGPRAFWATGSQYYKSHQELRNFEAMHADDWGVYTWTLDP